MEALNTLANMNPGNPTGNPQASAGSNRALWDYVGRAQEGGRQADQALGGWPGTVGDYMNEIASTPGVGAILPGAGAPGAAGDLGRNVALRNNWTQPTLHPNVLQVLRDQPDLMQWYKGATDATQRKDIINFITRNYVGR
jgi:hypothetical protein